VEWHGGVREDHDGTGCWGTRPQDDLNWRNLPQSTPHGIKPAVKKRGRGRLIGRAKGGMNTKSHAVTDTIGRPIRFFMTAGQVSDYTGIACQTPIGYRETEGMTRIGSLTPL
jgi:hypothetical protein